MIEAVIAVIAVGVRYQASVKHATALQNNNINIFSLTESTRPHGIPPRL